MTFSLQPAELVVTLNPTALPVWCMQLKKPNAHGITLSWWLGFARNVGEAVNILKSNTFPLGEEWLTAHIELKTKEAQLSLQVAPEHMARVLGTIKVSTANAPTKVAEYMISKIKADNENKWILPLPDPDVFTQTYKRFISSGSDMYSGLHGVRVKIEIDFLVISIDEELESTFRKSKIAKDIASLLVDTGSTNVTLKVGDTKLSAHKLVLGARSPVLKAMLSADMVEGRTGVIELQHISVEAAEAFLEFIYTAQIDKEKLLMTAEDLLPASTLYEMPDLHAVSEVALRHTIAVENVARLLLLASLHDASDLKADALAFVKRNKLAVTASDNWKDVIAANPKLVLESLMENY